MSGFFTNDNSYSDEIGVFKHINPFKYGYESLVNIEYEKQDVNYFDPVEMFVIESSLFMYILSLVFFIHNTQKFT